MEIEFNTGRIPRMGPGQPAVRPGSAPSSSDAVSFSASESLKNQLSTISTVRPEQVARATELVSDKGYPPDDVLDRIAALIAAKTQAGLPDQSS